MRKFGCKLTYEWANQRTNEQRKTIKASQHFQVKRGNVLTIIMTSLWWPNKLNILWLWRYDVIVWPISLYNVWYFAISYIVFLAFPGFPPPVSLLHPPSVQFEMIIYLSRCFQQCHSGCSLIFGRSFRLLFTIWANKYYAHCLSHFFSFLA